MAKTTADQKRTQGFISHLPTNMLIPKTFGEIISGIMRQKLNFLDGLSLVTSATAFP